MVFKDEDKFISISAPDIKPIVVKFKRPTDPVVDGEQYARMKMMVVRPSLNDYMDYEGDYAKFLKTFLPLFMGVRFLSYDELKKRSAMDEFVADLQKLVYKVSFIRAIKAILKRYPRVFIPEGIKIQNIDKELTKTEIVYLLLVMHMIVESEKKNTYETLVELSHDEALAWIGSFIFSKPDSTCEGPRFGKLI